jgi:hypothetical protein
MRESRKDNFYTAKLVAFLGDNFKNCLMLKQSGARPSDKGAVEALWNEVQLCMLEIRRKFMYRIHPSSAIAKHH